MKTRLKKGQTVMVYQDPLTRKNPEGKAKLIKYIKTVTFCNQHIDGLSETEGIEIWLVRFPDGNFTRSIKC